MNIVDKFIKMYGRLPTEYDKDYLELLRMTKYRILAVPDVTPAKCSNCGSSKEDGRKYIDFGLIVDWYGVVFLCSLCLDDVAKAIGLYKEYEDKIAYLNEVIAEHGDLYMQANNLNETLVRTTEELKEYYVSLSALNSGGDTARRNSLVTESSESSESNSHQTESRATEPSPESGRNNFPKLAELLNPDA